jgi:hypothetical protein
MMANSGPQKDTATSFSPGSPIAPTPGITLPSGPRAWTFPIGYNIGQLPRSTEETSFDTLRGLSSLYDGIMLAEQAWFDLCSRLEIEIKPTDTTLASVKGDKSIFADDITRYKAFFEMPDRDEDLDLSSWVIKALRDQLELDAVAIYVRLDKVGRPYSLELIDGATIKPLIDARGRKPAAPFPAYQQFWHGVPLGWYTSDQMLYHRETQRTDSVYGLSRVERIIMRVNQALRKQNRDLSRFTEGNLPPGMLELPPTDDQWTPDDILTFQRIWDGLLGGNDKTRSRLKVVPNGSKYTAIQDADIMTPFDSFLLNTTAACFGLTMAELGFTENVNKSSGESQENVVYRRAMRPLMNRYARLFTTVLRRYFKETRFIVTFKGFEEAEDLQTQANVYTSLVKTGMLTIPQANQAMGLPYEDKEPIPRFVMTATGPVFFDDLLDPELKDAKKQAQLSGFTLAQQTKPGEEPINQGNEDEEDVEQKTHTQGTTGKPLQPTQSNKSQGKSETRTVATSGHGTSGTGITIGQKNPASEDFRRWREVALKDVKAGKLIRPFISTLIPVDDHLRIYEALQRCSTADQVRAVFERARNSNDTGSWQLTDSDTLKQIAALKSKGVTHLRWISPPDACDECMRNDKVTVRIGEQFPTGALMPTQHPHCVCEYSETSIPEEEVA